MLPVPADHDAQMDHLSVALEPCAPMHHALEVLGVPPQEEEQDRVVQVVAVIQHVLRHRVPLVGLGDLETSGAQQSPA